MRAISLFWALRRGRIIAAEGKRDVRASKKPGKKPGRKHGGEAAHYRRRRGGG